MDNENFVPNITPDVPPPVPPPVAQPAVKKSKGLPKPLLIGLALGVIVLTALTAFVLSAKGGVKPGTQPSPSAPIPTPTPQRISSPVATQSAFLSLDSHVASLSVGLNNFILDDPQLTPPVLDLPLGF